MYSFQFFSFVILACSLRYSLVEGSNQCCIKEVEYEFLEYVTFEHCDGKDSNNYTLIVQFVRDSECSRKSNRNLVPSVLLSCSEKSKQNYVSLLKPLAQQVNPNGALENVEILYLVVSGPLEGKYVYFREVVQSVEFLKICSSILGYGYVNSKSATLLISEKLDLNMIVSPSGGYELFKKGCTTVCHGNALIVGPTDIIEVKD